MKRITPILIGLLVTATRLMIHAPSDLSWPHCAARHLDDPYGGACRVLRPDGAPWVVNPLTTALAVWPLAWLPLSLATAIVMGLSSAFLAWGLLKNGNPFRLCIFLSAPFFLTWYYGQWSALILGVALSPAALPLVLVKPHVGLPVLLTRLTRHRLLGVALFGLLSLLIHPTWPIEWSATLSTYDGYSVALVCPLVLLLLFRWRAPDARYLLLCALVPSRGIYDALITAAVLRTRQQLIAWIAAGWLPFILFPHLNADPLATIAVYLTTMAIVLATGGTRSG